MRKLEVLEAEYLAKHHTLEELMTQYMDIQIRMNDGGFNKVWRYRIPIVKRAIIIKQDTKHGIQNRI